ncbi:MAG: FtsQ-type POTRA domain-containing protein [Bacteroidetes bacterium]|nr:FtsQ-type POTRA domain-containing protein [Bacteroidota bacterium]
MTRQIIRNCLTTFFLFTTLLFAQSISSIEITGNKIFSVNSYLGWMKINAGTKIFPALEDSVRGRIYSSLRSEGYFHPTVNSKVEKIDSSKSKLIVDVDEGKPTIIGKIIFNSGLKDSLRLANFLSDLDNEVFTKGNIESAFSEIFDYYENIGLPFASVRIESVQFVDDSSTHDHAANLFLTIDEGTKSKIDKIEIEGNTKTKDNVITRALQIEKGEPYSQKQINDIPDKLNRLRFFEPVEVPTYFINSKNEGVLKISVKEKETNYFDGIAGYIPPANDNTKGYLTGFVNINLRNLFGTGRAASFRWQQENQYSQELEIQYLEPWLFGFPFNVQGSLFQRKQDSTYVQRNFEGALEYIATPEISASVIVNTQSTIPTERNVNVFTVYNSSAFTSGVNLKIDTRDDFYAPTSGILFVNSYKFTQKTINGPAQFIAADTKTKQNFQRLEFDFSIFKQFISKQVIAFAVHARELRGSDFEISDLYFLGGARSLRGYREKQFQGNRIIWSNLEYRFLLTRRTFAFLFFDSGYFLRNADETRQIAEISGFRNGYGFGINLETSLGVLGVSFALGKGDSISEGKIHFGIINEF